MCLFNESKLYIENAQKEHNGAFFVCTLQMWASIPALDFLGAMSQLPHLYSTVCPPKLTWIGFSTISFSSVLTAPTSIGSCSCSSLTGVAVGVGVVWVLIYWRSWGSSPKPISEHVLSNAAHPWATSSWPLATVQIAANYKNTCILISLTSLTCVPFTVFISFKPTSHYFSVTLFGIFIDLGHLLVHLDFIYFCLDLLIVHNFQATIRPQLLCLSRSSSWNKYMYIWTSSMSST